ncbi:MAG: SDR family oxidoreductase [Chloroflexota bacterium]
MAEERTFKRVMVTGGAGFIGSHIVDACVGAGHDVSVVDNLWHHGGGRRENVNPAARLHEVDITAGPALHEVFARERPEVVYHEAAQHSVKLSTDDPAYDARVNILGLLNVLSECVAAGTRKVIFASSGAIFGTPESQPVTPATPTRPESPYGITKMTTEHYLRFWKETHGLDYTALRYGNVYGPRQDPNGEAGVIAIFTRRILAGEGIRIDWDGEQAKDYVYVGDVARANLLALEAAGGQALLVGTGTPTSVNALYRQLTDLTGHEVPITRAPKRTGDVYLTYFDISETEQVLGWRPEVDLARGMRATVDYFRATG